MSNISYTDVLLLYIYTFRDCRNRFGWHIYFFNLIVYLLFITSLSVCVIYHRFIYAEFYFQRTENKGLQLKPLDNFMNSNTELSNNISDPNATVSNSSSANEVAFRQTVGIHLSHLIISLLGFRLRQDKLLTLLVNIFQDLNLSVSFTTIVVTFGLLNLVKEAYLMYLRVRIPSYLMQEVLDDILTS